MGQATNTEIRQSLLELKASGKTLKYISEHLGVPYATLRNLWHKHQKTPQSNLRTAYENCGKKPPSRSDVIYRGALWLKRLHPNWGSPLIHMHLVNRYGCSQVVHVRTIQRWFLSAHMSKPRSQKLEPKIGQSTQVHNIWQVDAKERLSLENGQSACYLTIVDEKSGACLEAPVFPLCPNQSSAH